jgi:hypothetical protein
MAINQGKFCFVILFQKAEITIFVIIFQNLAQACHWQNRRTDTPNQ